MADNYGQWYVTKMFTDAEAAAAASSNKITFLRMIASTDVFAQEDLATMTNNTISTIKAAQTTLIAGVTPANGTYKVQGVFTNTGVEDDYLMNTILLVASYNGSEFLAAAQVAKQPFKMPAAGTTEQTVYTIGAQIVVSNTATVNLTLDPKALVTNESLKIITDAQAVKDAAQDEATKTLSDKVPLFATLADAQTFAGIKTFTEKIIGSITGTAEKAVALVTSRKLKVKLDSTTDKTFNGTADVTDIGVSGVLQIANGGTSNAVGRAQGVNGNGLIFNSLAVGGTVVATAPLTSNYAKMFGSFGLDMAGSPLANKIFHCIVTYDATDRMDIIAVAKATGEIFTAQVVGTITDNTFTVTTAPVWTQVGKDPIEAIQLPSSFFNTGDLHYYPRNGNVELNVRAQSTTTDIPANTLFTVATLPTGYGYHVSSLTSYFMTGFATTQTKYIPISIEIQGNVIKVYSNEVIPKTSIIKFSGSFPIK